jgi:LytS/YehU family sensor histidine kinase
LYALTLKKSDLAPDIVLKLSNILRYVLYEGASQKRVSFYKEIEYLESYLELEKIRLGDRVRVELNIIGNFENKYIEPMLFINFVENSFKHGAAGNADKAWVDVKLELVENEVILNVKNSLGKSKIKIKKDKTYVGGIGLANTKKRLNLLYPNSHNLEIGEKEGKFEVQLKINLNE